MFPPSVQIPPAHREDAATAANNTPENGSVDGVEPPATVKKHKKNGGPTVDELKFVDYRYYRFLLHPDGMFRMIRCDEPLARMNRPADTAPTCAGTGRTRPGLRSPPSATA